MPCRGIRGATTVENNTVFTVTPDLTAAFPARAARVLGWRCVALLDAQEAPVPGSLPRCVRVLLHWNTDEPQSEIHHIYLHGVASLRPDLREKVQR